MSRPSDIDTVEGELGSGAGATATPSLRDTAVADTQLADRRRGDPQAADTELAGPAGPARDVGGRGRPSMVAPQVGRHVLFERIGAGGMGEVYAAWDPELDRRIAIKILHARPGTEAEREAARMAMLREAQAMAKISDPNVVSVFDVGTHGGQVYIAMEYVEGETLRAYAASHEPARVLDAYLQAARGLAAAHAEGLVHRDFKPDNALVGNDGRVRVLDFGIAAPASTGDSSVGAIVGTPGYMSPEQIAGAPPDARSDQFSFCASLYEALEGERPFEGRTVPEITRAVIEDAPRPLQRSQPRAVQEVIRRGLARDPDQRFADMHELIAMLDPERVRRRRRILGGIGVGVILAGGGLGFGLASAAAGACEVEHAPIHRAWDAETRSDVQSAFGDSGLGFADDAFAETAAGIDRYVRDWSSTWLAMCESARRSEQPARILERQSACLDGRRHRLEALLDGLRRADASSVEAAPLAVAELPSLIPCRDVASLTSAVELPESEQSRQLVAELRSKVESALADTQLARFDQALSVLEETERRALEPRYAPLDAEIALAKGRTLAAAERLDEARDALTNAYFTAYGSGHRDVAASSAVELVALVGRRLDEPSEGLRWSRHAQAAAAIVAPDPAREVRHLGHRAAALDANGDPQAALVAVDEALSRARSDDRISASVVPELLNVRASALASLGRIDESIASSRDAVAAQEALYGDQHPAVGRSLASLGGQLYNRRRLDDARPVLERSVRILSAAYGAESPAVAVPLNALAAVAANEARYDEALEIWTRLLEIRRRELGPAHDHTVDTLSNLAQVYVLRDQPDEAIELLTQAVSEIESKHGTESGELVGTLGTLADALGRQDRIDEALVVSKRACDLARMHHGDAHFLLAHCLHNRGVLLNDDERYEASVQVLREAVEIWARGFGETDPRLGRTSQTLGLSLFKTGRYDEARAAYRRALANMRRQSPPVPARIYLAASGLGRTEVAAGRFAEAIEPLERALEIGHDNAGVHAHAEFALARALFETGGDRSRVERLASQAHRGYVEAGEPGRVYALEVEAWGRERGIDLRQRASP